MGGVTGSTGAGVLHRTGGVDDVGSSGREKGMGINSVRTSPFEISSHNRSGNGTDTSRSGGDTRRWLENQDNRR